MNDPTFWRGGNSWNVSRNIFTATWAGTITPDADVWLSAADNLDYELSKSLSAGFCLKLAEAFGGF